MSKKTRSLEKQFARMGPAVRVYYNQHCDECLETEHEMVSIGAIIICQKCFLATFKTKNPVSEERDKYLAILRKKQEAQK